MPYLKYQSVTKTEWIKAMKMLIQDNPELMPKGTMCQKCGKPAFFANSLDGTSYCVECKADKTFKKTSSIKMLLPETWRKHEDDSFI